MSYRCDKCNAVYNGIELVVPTVVRNVDYHQHVTKFNPREREKAPTYYTTFKGWEVVKRERMCDTCYAENKDNTPTVAEPKSINFFSKQYNKKSGGEKQKFEKRFDSNKGKEFKSFRDL